MNPEQLAKSGTEHAHQVALFAWCAAQKHRFPELEWFHAIPNGGSRGNDAISRAVAGSKLKAEGVRKGIADCFLPAARGGFHGLYIEMKKPRDLHAGKRKGVVSNDQLKFAAHCLQESYAHRVCYSWQEAANDLEVYLQLSFTSCLTV